MYVPTSGMGSYRGMGDVALNCPGDPGCPGYVAPGSSEYQTSLLQEILANQQTPGMTPVVQSAAVPSTFTSWLNANATTVGIGAAVVVGLFLFMGRR